MRQRESIPPKAELEGFKAKVGLFSAKVKVEDANNLVTQLQNTFGVVNTHVIKIYEQLDTVFETIESIHKGSIEGIIVGVKSAQKAIEQAEYAIDKIGETLGVLQNFKNQLEENTEHLNDIDTIWNATQQLNDSFSQLETMLFEKTDELRNDIESFHDLMTQINGIKHLNDVDKLHMNFYDLLENYKKDIQNGKSMNILQNGRINEIQEILQPIEKQYKIISGLQHIMEVDNTWDCVQEEIEKMELLIVLVKLQNWLMKLLKTNLMHQLLNCMEE